MRRRAAGPPGGAATDWTNARREPAVSPVAVAPLAAARPALEAELRQPLAAGAGAGDGASRAGATRAPAAAAPWMPACGFSVSTGRPEPLPRRRSRFASHPGRARAAGAFARVSASASGAAFGGFASAASDRAPDEDRCAPAAAEPLRQIRAARRSQQAAARRHRLCGARHPDDQRRRGGDRNGHQPLHCRRSPPCARRRPIGPHQRRDRRLTARAGGRVRFDGCALGVDSVPSNHAATMAASGHPRHCRSAGARSGSRAAACRIHSS